METNTNFSTTTMDKSESIGVQNTPQTDWKHSYLEKIKATLEKQDGLIAMLKKRLEIEPVSSTLQSLNEHAILCFDTQNRITALEQENKARRDYFVRFVADFENKMKECDENYDKVVEYAKKKSKSNVMIEIAFEQYGTNPTNDIERKVGFYFRLKQLTKWKV